MPSLWLSGRLARIKKLEEKGAHNKYPPRSIAIASDETAPDYEGKQYVVQLAFTRAELNKMKSRENT